MKKLSVLLILLLGLIISCSLNDLSGTTDKKETAELEFSISLAKAPVPIISMTGFLSKSNEDTIWFDFVIEDDNASCKVKNIKPGEWQLTVNAYNAQNMLAYTGSTKVKINPGEETTVYLHLDPATGNLTVIVTWGEHNNTEKIVFQADYDGNYNIYVMNVDGTNIQQLTFDPSYNFYPKISPDREKIVFCSDRSGKTIPYIMNIDGSDLKALDISDKYVGSCNWSTDGENLVYHESYNGISDICIYNLKTGISKKILHNNSTNWIPNWSPSEDLILFFSNISGTFWSYLIHIDGTGMQPLTDHTMMSQERAPQYSPDGGKIAICGKRMHAQWGIFVVNNDGSGFQEILNTPRVDEQYPQWSPDGEKILFTRSDGRNKRHGIYTVDLNTKEITTLIDTEFDEKNAHWR